MGSSRGAEQAQYVQEMFGRIAKRYDLMNRLMTAGQDSRWRMEVIRRSQLGGEGYLLDLGAGTGDLAREAQRQVPGCRTFAADFTLKMMQVGRTRPNSQKLNWGAANALNLPFPEEAFDAVVSGFLLRNVSDIQQSLREQLRVLKTGGFMVALDTTRPAENKMQGLIHFYLNVIIPNLGRLITGEAEAYTYLPETTQSFLQAEQLEKILAQNGFQEVGFRRFMFGTIAIHWGRK